MVDRQMEFARLKPQSSIRDTIEATLSEAIFSGGIASGTVLSAPSLAVQFGVSPTPVREAMFNLERLGFVKTVRNKGFRVTEVSEKDLQDSVQIRCWLEGSAMPIVAKAMTSERLSACRNLAEVITESARQSDYRRYQDEDVRLHTAILETTGNALLVEMANELRTRTRLVGLRLMDGAELEKSAEEHHQLLDLIESGRGSEADALMRTHIGHLLGWWSNRMTAGADAST